MKPSAIRSHPHGPRLTDDGRLLVSPPSDNEPDLRQIVHMLAVKLDVIAVGLDALVTVEQQNGARLDALTAGVGAIGDKLDKLAATLDGIKLPSFLTPRR